MADVQTLQEQLAEATRERERARLAEQARIAAEQAHQKQETEAAQRVTDLQNQLRAARIKEGAEANELLVAENTAAIAPLLELLDTVGRQLADILNGQTVQSTFERQQSHANYVVNLAVGGVDVAAIGDQRMDIFERTGQNARTLMAQTEQKLNTGIPLWGALTQWINGASNEDTRRIRRGITLALTGFSLDPQAHFDPYKEVKEQRRQRFSRRF